MGVSIAGRHTVKVPPSDGRSAEAVLLRRTRSKLTVHVGGKPSETQKALINRAAMLTLHVARMDTKAIEAGDFSEHASKQYLAWSNTLSRTLALLGMKAILPPRLTVAEHLAARAAAKAAAQ